jgi:hypothetical protein
MDSPSYSTSLVWEFIFGESDLSRAVLLSKVLFINIYALEIHNPLTISPDYDVKVSHGCASEINAKE